MIVAIFLFCTPGTIIHRYRPLSCFEVKIAKSSKDGKIALWLPTNRSILYILVFAGSESTIIEITEYIYLSLL